MQIKQLLSDIAIGVIGGYVGTKVMEPVAIYARYSASGDSLRSSTPISSAVKPSGSFLPLGITSPKDHFRNFDPERSNHRRDQHQEPVLTA